MHGVENLVREAQRPVAEGFFQQIVRGRDRSDQ
jgi:hypothetical protein